MTPPTGIPDRVSYEISDKLNSAIDNFSEVHAAPPCWEHLIPNTSGDYTGMIDHCFLFRGDFRVEHGEEEISYEGGLAIYRGLHGKPIQVVFPMRADLCEEAHNEAFNHGKRYDFNPTVFVHATQGWEDEDVDFLCGLIQELAGESVDVRRAKSGVGPDPENALRDYEQPAYIPKEEGLEDRLTV